MNVLITGGAGYIGGLLIKNLADNPSVSKIIAIDLLDKPNFLKDISKKIIWIKADLAENQWQKPAAQNGKIDIAVHSAFRIRNFLGKTKKNEENNLGASTNVFDFCFDKKIKKVIYLSSIAAYGAIPQNIGKIIKEDEPLKENSSPYGFQKKMVEERLLSLLKKSNPKTKTIILRLATVTGPHGQRLKNRFGLITVLKKTLPFIIEPNPWWGRQFLHENDLMETIKNLLLSEKKRIFDNPEIFNIAPRDFLTAKDIAEALNKKTIKFPACLLKTALAIFWPISFGKLIPPSSVNSLIFPIKIDGGKITNKIGFKYKYSSKQALLA